MAAKKRRAGETTTSPAPASDVEPLVSPPRGSRWQLVVSAVLVALWIIFLAWMAFTG
jgi:hypothetical protein